MTDGQDRSDELERRLNDGYTRIGQKMAEGVEVDNWERHWIELLREYEQLNDAIAAHGNEVRQEEMDLGVRVVRDVA